MRMLSDETNLCAALCNLRVSVVNSVSGIFHHRGTETAQRFTEGLEFMIFATIACSPAIAQQRSFDVVSLDRARALKAANQYLFEKPITITASSSPRSAGGLHDFFSEG